LDYLDIINNYNYIYTMAKQTVDNKKTVKSISRSGIHSKSKSSKLKSSKLYKKGYNGQG